ncbi:MAG TPA: S8 family serine peptidase [Gaiellaceae bacterium]|nr:S8 family serine peptidase [Gaiellaceae bacterium]
MRRLLALCVAAAIVGGAGAARAATPPATGAPLVPRSLASLSESSHALVQVRRPGAAAELRRAGGSLVSRRLSLWRLPRAAAVRLIPRLAVTGALVEWEPDRVRTSLNHGAAGDPLVPQEWWLTAIGADRVDAPGPGRPVTIVDSGMDLTHPEFASRPDTRALNEQRLIGRREFHGTAVGAVVGAPANGIGMVGVYPAAVLQTWDASPRGELTTSGVVTGLEAAAASGPGVINLSIGGIIRSSFEEEAVLDAVARGSIVVAASGNDRGSGNPPNFPASYPHVVTVGSLAPGGAVSTFSSSSPGMDLLAPGESIVGAVPTWESPDGYEELDGTSFASPIVAAAAAWVWTARPDLDGGQVVELLRRTAHDLEAPGRDDSSGFGTLDLAAALAAPAPPRDPFEPNDDVSQVRGGGLLGRVGPALTTPGRGRGSVGAVLNERDDPRDVYRVWVPARKRVVATPRPAAAVGVNLLGPRPSSVRVTQTKAGLEIRNAGSKGREVYLAATLRAGATRADYTVTLATSAIPRKPAARR